MLKADVPVLIGEDNFLFLTNDTNDSVRQFTGEISLSERSAAGWTQHFRSIKRWESQYGYKSAFLVSPAKEFVLPDMMPIGFNRGVETPIDTFRRIVGAEDVLYPVQQLRRMRYLAYDRTDSHWSDAGSAIAASEVVRLWGFKVEDVQRLMSGFCIKMSIGDLGNKFDPPKADFTLRFDWSVNNRIKFDNFITNNGNIKCFINDDARSSDICLIFGDSFSHNLAPALSNLFKEVYFTYKPGCFDSGLVDIIRPQFVLHEIAQRFIIGQPNPTKSIFDVAAEKIDQLASAERATVKANLQAVSGHYKHEQIAERMLSYL